METPGPSENQSIPLFSIGTAARILSLSVQTLRMYEREGLVIPFKSDTNQRWYSQADIERIQCIRKAINEEKMSIQGIRRIQALIPCWEIIGCSETDRLHCEAFNGHARGCWTYDHRNNECENVDCRLCEVYLSAGDCDQIKRMIIQASNHAYALET